MIPDDFARFLERLSPDREEAGRLYTRLHHKLAGFLSMKGVSDPVGAADEVIERAAVRIGGGADVPNLGSYCIGIARNVARERWRNERREEKVFRRFTESLADDSAEEVERIQSILKPCFEQLEDRDRQLLVAYCRIPEGLSHAEYRRRLADEMGMSVRALRIHVSRLRDRLEDCVARRSEKK